MPAVKVKPFGSVPKRRRTGTGPDDEPEGTYARAHLVSLGCTYPVAILLRTRTLTACLDELYATQSYMSVLLCAIVRLST